MVWGQFPKNANGSGMETNEKPLYVEKHVKTRLGRFKSGIGVCEQFPKRRRCLRAIASNKETHGLLPGLSC